MSAWSSSWQLPDQIADVLPSEARHIEELRRLFLDLACGYGYELVMPPLLEHLESLLTGTGEALDLQTFKLVDQLSGRTLGLRADTTPQVARIDAHLLNRQGVARLCYCGPVLHTRADRPYATREPLQMGAEIYGHAGLEAELESQLLALEGLQASGVDELLIDMADVRVVNTLLQGAQLNSQVLSQIHAALAAKDRSELASLLKTQKNISTAAAQGLQAVLQLYGDAQVLLEAQKILQDFPAAQKALQDMRWLAQQLTALHPGVQVSFDLADLHGYAYYSGTRFAIYGRDAELVRGGRYDEVGAVFGRNRPAAGFSLDLKNLATVLACRARKLAIRAPWGTDAPLREAIAHLRAGGETVACILPGHAHEVDEFIYDRQLLSVAGQWVVQPLSKTAA